MSTFMSLSDQTLRPESSVITRLRPRPARPQGTEESAAQDRFAELETRLDRLESGHHTALDLVRQALDTLKRSQAEQNTAQCRDLERLAARLSECEFALDRLTYAQRRDDETMRERLFDMGEALQGVRATASAAVKPGALRRLERKLEQEMESRSEVLREEMSERLTGAIEAAEGRSADAIDALEENVWDDLTEIARRFDSLADSVLDLRNESDTPGEQERAPVTQAQAESESGETSDPYTDEEGTPACEMAQETDPRDRRPEAGVIPFPAQEQTLEDSLPEANKGPVRDVGTLLSAAARRANQDDKAAVDHGQGEDVRSDRTFLHPVRRLMTSAGSATMAVCIMAGLSLLAGPTLGPNLQGTPPAFALDRPAWTSVEVAPQPVAISPRLTPVLEGTGTPHPLREAHRRASDR